MKSQQKRLTPPTTRRASGASAHRHCPPITASPIPPRGRWGSEGSTLRRGGPLPLIQVLLPHLRVRSETERRLQAVVEQCPRRHYSLSNRRDSSGEARCAHVDAPRSPVAVEAICAPDLLTCVAGEARSQIIDAALAAMGLKVVPRPPSHHQQSLQGQPAGSRRR